MRAVIERLNQMFLRAEIVVGVAQGYPRLFGDGAHGRLFVSALVKNLQGRIQNERFGLLTLLGLGWFCCPGLSHTAHLAIILLSR